MIKGSIQEEDVRIINIYAPNIGAPPYVGIFNSFSPVIEIYSYCIVIRKDAWNDFNFFFEFTKARFMAQDLIYPGEVSMSP